MRTHVAQYGPNDPNITWQCQDERLTVAAVNQGVKAVADPLVRLIEALMHDHIGIQEQSALYPKTTLTLTMMNTIPHVGGLVFDKEQASAYLCVHHRYQPNEEGFAGSFNGVIAKVCLYPELHFEAAMVWADNPAGREPVYEYIERHGGGGALLIMMLQDFFTITLGSYLLRVELPAPTGSF